MKLGSACAVFLAGVVLCGCASRDGRIVKRDLPQEVDEGKIAAVNDWAVHRGAVVRWVNLPTRKVAAASDR
ncbi:MAG TPA: hypothetical protein PLN91_09220 [Rhodanobacteraceae bacterium]|nr:hypothetical protein [Rhodanobacteraceae bacterium]